MSQPAVSNALKSAGISPASVSYVEAHGTGTVVGDPIEVNAIGEIYGANRPPEQKCLVASVKLIEKLPLKFLLATPLLLECSDPFHDLPIEIA